MSRPSKIEAAELERLECLAAFTADIVQATGILAIRMRQIMRRVEGEPAVMAVAQPASKELARIVDAADDMHRLIGCMLEERQRERTEKNCGNRR
jgi:hypothetical protein